jgi:hypothetical protein
MIGTKNVNPRAPKIIVINVTSMREFFKNDPKVISILSSSSSCKSSAISSAVMSQASLFSI